MACKMSKEINFSDLNEVQKEQYIKYILENNIPLQEDSTKQSIVAEIKLQTSQKKIISKYASLKSDQLENNYNRNESPKIKQSENNNNPYNNISALRKQSISPNLYQSTPIHPKRNQIPQSDNKENEYHIKQITKSPNQQIIRSSTPLSSQIISGNKNTTSNNHPIKQRLLFHDDQQNQQQQQIQNVKSPERKKSLNINNNNNIKQQQSILKEINFNTKNQIIPTSDNKRQSINVNNISPNRYESQQKQQNQQQQQLFSSQRGKLESKEYIPSTLRKSSIKETESSSAKTINKSKNSLSPNTNMKKRKESTTQIQVYSAKSPFSDKNNNINNNNLRKSRDNSNNLRLSTENNNNQDPFNLTISTIHSKDNNSKNTNSTIQFLNKQHSKCDNILIIDNNNSNNNTSTNHSQSTSSSNSSNQNSQFSQQQQTQINKNNNNNPNDFKKQNKMNEIYDILKSVGFCSNNNTNRSNNSEWQSVTGGEMRSDPQELSMKLDSKNLFPHFLQDDLTQQSISDDNNTYQSEYLNILNQKQNQSNNIKEQQLLNSNNNRNNSVGKRGRSTTSNQLSDKNNINQSPNLNINNQRKKSISYQKQQVNSTTPIRNRNNIDVSPSSQKIEKTNIQQQQSQDNFQITKEIKLNSQISQLFKNKFSRLIKLPITHTYNLIEDIITYAAKENNNNNNCNQLKQYKSNSIINNNKSINNNNQNTNNNNFKEFVYDYFMKKYKNNSKISESHLFNFIGSVEYHNTNNTSIITSQFLSIINNDLTEDQYNLYLLAYHEILHLFKTKTLQNIQLQEKSVFSISHKLFNHPDISSLCYEIIEQVYKEEQFIQSQTIQAYDYLEIILNVYKSSHQNLISQNDKNNKIKNNNNNQSNPVNVNEIQLNQPQRPFTMVNESFGFQNDLSDNHHFKNNFIQMNQKITNDHSITNHIDHYYSKSLNSNNNMNYNNDQQSKYNSSVIQSSNTFFSNQYDENQFKKTYNQIESQKQTQYKINTIENNNNNNQNTIKIQQNIQYALFDEMDKIVSEFVSMFDIQNKESKLKLQERILKKCKLLILSLITKENSKWFNLLLIDYPNYQQKMQAETIMKLYEAYERSFILNNQSQLENKNLRSLCKLILKVPELNDAISKLLICVLVPDS